ncbi:thioredoxin [Synechococcus sp. M16CYN]|uniref:thioredoxin n=1 Tax=Synechococcus sp. M16CYN TaxID=3103139 RepID=UPI00333EFD40
MASAVVDFTDNGFETEVLKASNAVLVDFWAPWCGPCRLIAPLMTWAAETYCGRLSVGKLEVDGNPATRDAYQVQGIPTLILFHHGRLVTRHEGAIAQPQLKALLDAAL